MKTASTQYEIYSLVAAELSRVEEELAGYTVSDVDSITEVGRYLLDAGGKRIRPALLLLTARMLGEASPSIIRLAAIVELIHNATLVHDDVIDAADTRRGHPSANAQWGNPMTVLAGDWLYMQSFAVALQERNFEILSTLIDITQKMVEGELLQLTLVGRRDVEEKQLLEVAERKTASLFSGCMRLPGLAVAPGDGLPDRLGRIGLNLGMAFQLVDDLLDLTSTRERLGKPVASDLKEGKVTLPLYYALVEGGDDAAREVETVLREREFRSVRPDVILARVRSSSGLDRTRRLAEEYAGRAARELERLPRSIYRDALLAIPEFILSRQV